MTEHDPELDDDVALSALLDDALPAEQAERLCRRLAAEPALARRLEQLQQADRAVRATYAGVADEPLPQRVVALLQPRPAVVRVRRWSMPLVAGLALAAGLFLGFVVLPHALPRDPLSSIAEGGLVVEGSDLYAALQTVHSGASYSLGRAWSATPRLTFIGLDGEPCRRVDMTGTQRSLQALACRRGGAWRLELMAFGAAVPPAADGVYRPAAGPRSPIDEAIDARIDGAPLGREAEQAWIARGWENGGGPGIRE